MDCYQWSHRFSIWVVRSYRGLFVHFYFIKFSFLLLEKENKIGRHQKHDGEPQLCMLLWDSRTNPIPLITGIAPHPNWLTSLATQHMISSDANGLEKVPVRCVTQVKVIESNIIDASFLQNLRRIWSIIKLEWERSICRRLKWTSHFLNQVSYKNTILFGKRMITKSISRH